MPLLYALRDKRSCSIRRACAASTNHPDQAPGGAGEAVCRPVAGAIANALFDATAVRLRRAPLTAARVKAALG